MANTTCDVAPSYDITIEQGATYIKTFVWEIDNVAVDLTGYTALMEIKKVIDDSVVITLSTENGRISLANDMITLTVNADDTLDLKDEECRYVLELITINYVKRFLVGNVIVSRR
jgi:hypothetical protein